MMYLKKLLTNKDILFSFDRANFMTVDEFIFRINSYNAECLIEFYFADKCKLKHSDIIDMNKILSAIRESAFEQITISAWSDVNLYLDDLTECIEKKLGVLISDFLDNHIEQPIFSGVKNVRKASGIVCEVSILKQIIIER